MFSDNSIFGCVRRRVCSSLSRPVLSLRLRNMEIQHFLATVALLVTGFHLGLLDPFDGQKNNRLEFWLLFAIAIALTYHVVLT